MSAGYNQFVLNRTLKVTHNGNHHFMATPLSTIDQLGLFLPSEPKRKRGADDVDGRPNMPSTTAQQEDERLIQLLQSDLNNLTHIITENSPYSGSNEFEPIDNMNNLLGNAERRRREGNTTAMKINLRELHAAVLRFNVNDFGVPPQSMETVLASLLGLSAKYANFEEPVPDETKESSPRDKQTAHHKLDEAFRVNQSINRIPGMYAPGNKKPSTVSSKKPSTVSSNKTPGASIPSNKTSETTSVHGPRPSRKPNITHRQPGVTVRVTLTRPNATGKIADLLRHCSNHNCSRNLILHQECLTTYTFQYNSGNHPRSADISKDDVMVESIINMDKPDVLKTGMLVQVKNVDQPWWTAKYLEMPGTEEQLAKLKEELNKPLIVLKQELKELRNLNYDEDRPKFNALNRSTIDEKKREIAQYERQADQKLEKLKRGMYVVEDGVATYVDPNDPHSPKENWEYVQKWKAVEKWEFEPYGDDNDEWRFPDCPVISMSTKHIQILNKNGVFEPVIVTEIGETGGWDNAPEHIVTYERPQNPGTGYILDTWIQQYKMGWDDEKQEDAMGDNNYIYNSENDAPPCGDSDMDEVWEHLYNVNDIVEHKGQRGTVSNVDVQNRSYTINFDTSAVSNVQEDKIVPTEQLQYTPGHLVLYNFRVCRIIRLNANNYTLEQTPHKAENIEALFEAFQSSHDQDWRTFLFTGAETVTEVSDRALQEYCLIQTNGVRSICKKNGVTKRYLKLLNERGQKRKVTLNSKNIKEPEEVNDIIEAMFRQEQDDTVEPSYWDFEVGQMVEVYDNGQMTLVHRRLAALHQELDNLEHRLAREKRKKWKSLYRSDIDKKNQEIMQYQGLVSGKWPIGTIVEHETNKIKEQESYRVEVNGTTKLYSVSQLGSLQPVPSSMSGAARLAAGVDDAAVDDGADDDEYIDSETEDIAMSNSADENDNNDSGLDEEWVPLAEVGAIVKIIPTNEILSVDSIDYDSEQTKMSDGNKYRNDQFDIYIEDIESEPDEESKYNEMDDETDSEDSADEF